MQGSALTVLRICMWLICAFHVVTGLAVNISQPLMEVIAAGYGASVDFTPQFKTILHPLGAFMFILGVMAAAAAVKPVQYRAVVYAFAALFIIRGLQRIIFKQQIEEAFQIDSTRNLFTIVVFIGMGIALATLELFVDRQRSQASVAN